METLISQNKKLKELLYSYEEENKKLKEANEQHENQIQTLLKFNQRLLNIIESEFSNKNGQQLQAQNKEQFSKKQIGSGQLCAISEKSQRDSELATSLKVNNKKIPSLKINPIQEESHLQENSDIKQQTQNFYKKSNPKLENSKKSDRYENDQVTGNQLLQIKDLIALYKSEFTNGHEQVATSSEKKCMEIRKEFEGGLVQFKKIANNSINFYNLKLNQLDQLRQDVFEPVRKLQALIESKNLLGNRQKSLRAS